MKNFIAILAFTAVISVDKSEAYQLSHKSHQRWDVKEPEQEDMCEYDFEACTKTFNHAQKKEQHELGMITDDEKNKEIAGIEDTANAFMYN